MHCLLMRAAQQVLSSSSAGGVALIHWSCLIPSAQHQQLAYSGRAHAGGAAGARSSAGGVASCHSSKIVC
jgi:hypothetical protein